jgi:glucose-6-phosphate 1-dehydrogenase
MEIVGRETIYRNRNAVQTNPATSRGIGQASELVASRHAGPTEMDAYERVLTDAMAGDRTLFAREDYVEEAWRIVDPVLKADTPVHIYEPGTWGPQQAACVAPPEGWHNPMIAQSAQASKGAP